MWIVLEVYCEKVANMLYILFASFSSCTKEESVSKKNEEASGKLDYDLCLLIIILKLIKFTFIS